MITNFIGQIKSKRLARTNRYRVRIPFPTTDGRGVQLAELFCEAVTLPGVTIATTAERFYGEKREMPYERMFDPVTMNFYVDTEMTVKRSFDSWLNYIINPSSRAVQYYNSYTRNIQIYVDTVDEKTPYMLTLYEAYPKSIGTIQMGYESREIMKLSVTLEYRYWDASNESFE